MAGAVFGSKAEFDAAAHTAGVDKTNCAWFATTELVHSMLGIGIDNTTEQAVRDAYAGIGQQLGNVEIAEPSKAGCSARIGCTACGQELLIRGLMDAQGFGTVGEPECPIWEAATA